MSQRKAITPDSRRAPLWALVLLVLMLVPGSVVASSGFLQSLPPEEVLRYQPRTSEEATRLLGRALAVPNRPGGSLRFAEGAARSEVGSARWQEVGPPLGAGRALLYDSRRGRLLQVGGEFRSDGPTVWSWSAGASGWLRISEQPDPGGGLGRFLAAAYDSAHDRLLVLRTDGPGVGAPPVLDALTLSTSFEWQRLWSGPVGSGISNCVGLVVDTRRDRCGIVGARDPATGANGFAWIGLSNPSSWEFVAATGVTFSGNEGGSALYDAHRDSVWAIVGGDPGYLPGPVLRMAIDATGAVSGPVAEAMGILYPCEGARELQFDRDSDRLILVTARGNVRLLPLAGGPVMRLEGEFQCDARREGLAIAFDPVRRRLYQSGGRRVTFSSQDLTSISTDGGVPVGSASGGTSGTSWFEEQPFGLGSRIHHSAQWESSRGRLIVFGGWSNPDPLRQTMALRVDGRSGWEPLGESGPKPPIRFAQSFALDPVGDAALLFGGQATDGTGDYLGDLWRLPLAGGTWESIAPGGDSPGLRRGAAFFHDPLRDRWILMGGDDGVTLGLSAWELKLRPAPVWRQLAVLGDAAATRVSPFADPASGVWWGLSFNGTLYRIRLGDDSLTGEAVPIQGELPSAFTVGSFDSVRRRFVLFHREQQHVRTLFSEPLALQVGDIASVAPLALDPSLPPVLRWFHATAFDAAADRMLVVGGYDDGDLYFGDTWQLQWQTPVPVAATLARSEADAAGTRLEWHVSGAGSASGAVERSADGVEWFARGAARVAGTDALAFDDTPLAPGERAAYRLIVRSGAERIVTATAWVQRDAVTAALMLAAAENPARGPLRLRFSLPHGEPATLTLFDAGGRILEQADLAPTQREWSFAAPRAPGLYLARLQQGRESRLVKLAASR